MENDHLCNSGSFSEILRALNYLINTGKVSSINQTIKFPSNLPPPSSPSRWCTGAPPSGARWKYSRPSAWLAVWTVWLLCASTPSTIPSTARRWSSTWLSSITRSASVWSPGLPSVWDSAPLSPRTRLLSLQNSPSRYSDRDEFQWGGPNIWVYLKSGKYNKGGGIDMLNLNDGRAPSEATARVKHLEAVSYHL